MFLVASLHGEAEHAGIHLVAVGRTVVVNTGDITAQSGDDRANLYQFTRFVIQLHLDGAETAALGKTTGDDAVQDGYVDITAAYHADGFLALHRNLVVHYCCHAGRTGTFGYHLLTLYEFQDGCTDLILAHCYDFVYIVGAGFKSNLSRFLYGNTISYGRYRRQLLLFMIVQTLDHTCCSFCLNTIYLDVRIQRLDGKGYARDKSAATYRNDDSFYIWQLVENLQTDGALPGDDILIIERMNEGVAMLIFQFQRLLVGIIVNARYQTDFCTQSLGSFYLGDRSTFRQTDEALDAHGCSSQRYTLCMVARRTGYHTLRLFFIGEL